MSIYRIRMTRGKKLDSNDTNTALAMDMLNELRKCPMPLYDVISKKGQDFFLDEVDGDDIIARLASIDYHYDSSQNRFK